MTIVVLSLLIAAVVAPVLAGSACAEGERVPGNDPWTPFVTEASQRFDVPTSWIRAILNAESAGDASALSPKGAMGLMQLMPETWSELRSRHGLGADPFDPRDNILAGTAYVRELLDRYGTWGLLAAYNAGPTRLDDHLTTGRPLPAETRAFVAALAPTSAGDQPTDEGNAALGALAWTGAPLFIQHTRGNLAADRPLAEGQPWRSPNAVTAADVSALAPQSGGLFVRLMKRAGRQ